MNYLKINASDLLISEINIEISGNGELPGSNL